MITRLKITWIDRKTWNGYGECFTESPGLADFIWWLGYSYTLSPHASLMGLEVGPV